MMFLSEGNGGKPVANWKANVQLLQSVGGNGGKSLITPGNDLTISERTSNWGQSWAASVANWWQVGRQITSHTNQLESMESNTFIHSLFY